MQARPARAGWAGLAVAVATAAAAIWLTRPPAPLPAAAPPERFAAGRAQSDVEALAAQPRPLGSAAHRQAGDALQRRMAELGLVPAHQETMVAHRGRGGEIRAARVRNLLGRLPGEGGGSGSAILLLAHYDSRPNTPGAGDDAAGVAVVLEVVRAVRRGPPLARDLLVLLSDGEELGLLGARAFAAEHPWHEQVGLVLNFEGRGSRGPVAMFETGTGDLELVRAFAAAAPHPLASSLSAEVYARMPNDTDFTVFREAGRSGLNFAFLGGIASYHSALDTPARLAPASLQQAGANALALVRNLDRAPPSAGAEEALYFNPWPGKQLVLAADRALPLALGGALAAVALALVGLRRRRVSVGGLSRAVLLGLAAPPLASAVAATAWNLTAWGVAQWLVTPYQLPYRLELTGIGLLLIGLAAAAGLAGLRWELRSAEPVVGLALVFAALGVPCAALAPGASFLFLWPLAGLLLAALATVAGSSGPAAATLVATAGALPGVILLSPLAALVFSALTPRQAALALAPAMLAATLLLPALLAVAAGRQRLALAALAVGAATLGLALSGGYGEARPRTGDLAYLEVLHEGKAFRLSRDERPSAWVREQLESRPERWSAPFGLEGAEDGKVWRGTIAPATAAGPEVTRISDRRSAGRRVVLRIGSPAGAPLLRVEARSSAAIEAVELAGRRFERPGDEALEPVRLLVGAPAPAGVEVAFELGESRPLGLSVTELFYGLPAGVPPPPPGLIPALAWSSHARLVHRSFLR